MCAESNGARFMKKYQSQVELAMTIFIDTMSCIPKCTYLIKLYVSEQLFAPITIVYVYYIATT